MTVHPLRQGEREKVSTDGDNVAVGYSYLGIGQFCEGLDNDINDYDVPVNT